ncbi:hypothetical protein BvCmsKSNP073_03570 [Escherichia coli]|nr:hypothetical protein BvCmsKSNP073_03570 [Escherichia coli]
MMPQLINNLSTNLCNMQKIINGLCQNLMKKAMRNMLFVVFYYAWVLSVPNTKHNGKYCYEI